MDYFTKKHMKILASNPSSYIKVEFGSWTAISLDEAKGEAKANIERKNGGSHVNFDFSFKKEYMVAVGISIMAVAFLIASAWSRTSMDISLIDPSVRDYFILKTSLFTLAFSLVTACIILGIVMYSTSLTKRRHLEEFETFIQSFGLEKR